MNIFERLSKNKARLSRRALFYKLLVFLNDIS